MTQHDSELEQLSRRFSSLNHAEVAFIDEAFKRHGASLGHSFGDYSKGLVSLSTCAIVELADHGTHYFVTIVCHAEGWDFAVSIDKATGAFVDPVQGQFSVNEPDGDR